jgi:hypothetical protein
MNKKLSTKKANQLDLELEKIGTRLLELHFIYGLRVISVDRAFAREDIRYFDYSIVTKIDAEALKVFKVKA